MPLKRRAAGRGWPGARRPGHRDRHRQAGGHRV